MTADDLKDVLSDIDNLLDGGDGGGETPPDTAADDFSRMNDYLRIEARVLSENWSTVSPTKVTFTAEPAKRFSIEEIKGFFPAKCVSSEVAFAGDIAGASYFLLPEQDAVTGGALLMMLEGDELANKRNAPYASEEADAYGELVNMFIGNTIVAVKPVLNVANLTMTRGEMKLADFPANEPDVNTIFKFPEYIGAVFTVNIGDFPPSQALRIFSLALAGQLQGEAAPSAEGGFAFDENLPAGSKESPSRTHKADSKKLERVLHIKVPVIVEVSMRRMRLEDVMNFCPGYIIQFTKRSDQFLDLLINDRKVGEGEVVFIGDQFGMQIKKITNVKKKYKSLSQ